MGKDDEFSTDVQPLFRRLMLENFQRFAFFRDPSVATEMGLWSLGYNSDT